MLKEVTEDNVEYIIPAKNKKKFNIILWVWKTVSLAAGIFISLLLYNKCLFCKDVNTIVTIYFSVIGLSCFDSFGLPVSELAKNVKLS